MTAMKRKSKRKLIYSAGAVILILAGIVGGRLWYLGRPGYGMPYFAKFTPDGEDRWTAYGGTWEVVDGSVRNDSNDRGAKLLTGSPHWRDYTVQGDVQLLGEGSAGFLARVSEAELGENSYKGYFGGVRTVDNSLVIGSYDFAYHEVTKVPLPDPVRPFRWYHVKLTVEGCSLTASVWGEGLPELKTRPVIDPDCYRSGEAGMRSNGTGGVWRSVSVAPAGTVAPPTALPDPPAFHDASLQPRSPGGEMVAEEAPSGHIQAIRSLQFLAPFAANTASIRGTVVLIRPAIFVEDSLGGGIEVQTDGPTPVKIGDEVEVTGEVNLEGLNPTLRKARVRLLGQSVPIQPLSLTANQIAEGHYDGWFVQVEGHLHAKSEKDGRVTLDLDAGTQSFHAILPPGRSRSHAQDLALQSRLRLRGVSVVDPRYNTAADPFVILVRSAEDVDVVAGPPWYRPSNLILGGLVALALVFTLNYLYLLANHWRLRTVAEERERLAHEIHDTLAQSFAGIGFQLQAIRNSLLGGAPVLERQVDRAMLMARTSHEEARRSIANLHPASLGHMGLLPALRECAERMVSSGKVRVETEGEDEGRMVPLHVKDTLFRIGQEAIANSIRHAEPDTIRIRLHQQGAFLVLSVEDDGHGFIADGDHAGFGLLGMQKRAERISAILTVRSAPGRGTQVEVKAATGSSFLSVLWDNLGARHRDSHN